MDDYGRLSRERILASIDELASDAAFAPWRDVYLRKAVMDLDLELTSAMLRAGGNPNVQEPWGDGFLHHLVHEYLVSRSTQGDRVLAIAGALLAGGADPNLVGCNNLRAYDLAVESCRPFGELLLRSGADPSVREFI